MYYYVDILGLLVGVGTKGELQVDGKRTKLNVIAIEVMGTLVLKFSTYIFCCCMKIMMSHNIY